MTYFYVYIIRSTTLGIFYKGSTADYKKRLNEHNLDLGRYTKGKGPWEMVHLERFETKKEALIREKQIKRYNRVHIERLCKSNSNLLNKPG